MRIADAHKLAYEMVYEHLPHSDWQITLNRSRHRAGMTDYGKGLISLSIPFIESYSRREVEQLMLHEIAHVLVGPDHAHDKEWKRTASSIGYEGKETVAPLKTFFNEPWKGWVVTFIIFVLGPLYSTPTISAIFLGVWVTAAVVSLWRRLGPVPGVYKPLK